MIPLLVWGWLSPAWAQDSRAKELFENGVQLYNEGRYEDAIVAWEHAYEMAERPLLLYNLSNAYERAGQFEKALDALNRYRAFAAADERESIDSRIRNLEARVDSERAQRQATEQKLKEQEAALAKERARAAQLQREREATDTTPRFPVLPVALTAAGVGLLAGGTVSGLGARSKRQTLRDSTVCADSGVCRVEAEPLVGPQKTGALLADIGIGTGVVATGVGAFLLLKHVRGTKSAAVGFVSPTASGATMGVQGAF